MNVARNEKKRLTRGQIYAPKSFHATFWTMNGLLIAGFAPSVIVYLRTSKWYINPFVRPKAWGNPNTATMSLHSMTTLAWMSITVIQIAVTGLPNFRGTRLKLKNGINIRSVHRAAGYAGLALCLGMTVSAFHLTAMHGVAGKLSNNGFALLAGGAMAYHIVKGIEAVRGKAKDRKKHLWHMTGLFAWTCFPGFARSLFGALPNQLILFGSDAQAFDIWYTSGSFVIPFLASGLGHYLLQYFVLGPERFQPRLSDFAVYGIAAALEVAAGLVDGSLLSKPQRPLMAQVPGKPWVIAKTP